MSISGRIRLRTLAEKSVTIALTFRIQITDDVLKTKPSYLPP